MILRTVVSRIAVAIPTLLIMSFVVFLLVELAPGDAAQRIAGPEASPAVVQTIREELRLDDPFVERYVSWLGDAVQGDFGLSLATRSSAMAEILNRIPITASLALISLLIAIVFGLILGIIAALRPDGWVDRGIALLCSVAVATPSFWIGMVLVLFFAVDRQWFPASGYSPLSEGVFEWFKSLLLPAIALAGVPTAEIARQLRGAMIEVLSRDYVMTAHAKGLPQRTIILKHALKNAAITPITVLGFRIAQMIGGTVVVEELFILEGLGRLTFTSIQAQDVVVVQNIVLFTMATVLVINLLVDLSYAYFNPKLRKS